MQLAQSITNWQHGSAQIGSQSVHVCLWVKWVIPYRYNSITYEMSLLQVNFGKWFSLSSLMHWVQRVRAWLWVLANCKGCVRGGANLRGLIMTPYYSLQELPSFAHHITCMAWHGNRRCMSFLTQLGTYWLQGKLLHECLAAVPARF